SGDVGAREGQDRKRTAPLAFQGGVYVASRLYPADARNSVEDETLPGALRCDGAALSRVEGALATVRDDDGTGRPCDDQNRQARRPKACAREPGHQQDPLTKW